MSSLSGEVEVLALVDGSVPIVWVLVEVGPWAHRQGTPMRIPLG